MPIPSLHRCFSLLPARPPAAPTLNLCTPLCPLATPLTRALSHPLLQAIKYASSSSLAVIRRGDGSKWLALAYQASDKPYEGSRSQHLRFSLSKDGGETFSPGKPIMWGAAPLWSPSLHHDPGEQRAAS